MSFLAILLISIGLAMDAFAVSIGLGIKERDDKLKTAVRASLMFGAFQAFMPIIGWYAGSQFKSLISSYDHWAAFGLLMLIGGKMLYESAKQSGECEAPKGRKKKKSTTFTALFLLAVATSIDALAVGVSFAFLDMQILVPVIVIGTVAFLFSFLGVELGNMLGCRAKTRAELIGGLILVALGVKILLEHTYF